MLQLAIRGQLAGLLVVMALGAGARTAEPADPAGKYQLAGTAHVSVSPFPTQEYPGEISATLSRRRADAFALRMETRGYACTLPVVVAADGSVAFPERATCPLDVSEPDARGHLEARLRSARGHVGADTLEMDLQLDVKGSVQLKIPSRTIRILGSEIQTPATWTPSALMHGTVSATARGARRL